MKLGAYKINGEAVGADLEQWDTSDLNGNDPFQAKDTLDAGYEDISSVENWDKYHDLFALDYKFVRDIIGGLVLTETNNLADWNTYDAAKQEIAARWFVVPEAQREDVYTIEQQIGLGQIFNKCSVEARTLRVSKATSEIYNRLSGSEAQVIINDVTGSDNLFVTYVNFGREGSEEGDGEGLFDYMEGRTGTTWESTGFDSYSYTPIGYTDMATLSIDLMKILKDGEY